MLIKLRRTKQNAHSTAGELSIDDLPLCVTLEDGWHVAKLPGITRIPAGMYRVTLRTEGGNHAKYLERFGPDFHKGMLWIRDVPDFEHVQIHCGNRVEDTSGCVLAGSEIIEPASPDNAYEVLASEKAYREIYPTIRDAILRKEDTWIQVIDPKLKVPA